jgi:hypothetical protein
MPSGLAVRAARLPTVVSADGEVGEKAVDDSFLFYGYEVVKHCVSKSVVPGGLHLADRSRWLRSAMAWRQRR